jgi:hypothetical protein
MWMDAVARMVTTLGTHSCCECDRVRCETNDLVHFYPGKVPEFVVPNVRMRSWPLEEQVRTDAGLTL